MGSELFYHGGQNVKTKETSKPPFKLEKTSPGFPGVWVVFPRQKEIFFNSRFFGGSFGSFVFFLLVFVSTQSFEQDVSSQHVSSQRSRWWRRVCFRQIQWTLSFVWFAKGLERQQRRISFSAGWADGGWDNQRWGKKHLRNFLGGNNASIGWNLIDG